MFILTIDGAEFVDAHDIVLIGYLSASRNGDTEDVRISAGSKQILKILGIRKIWRQRLYSKGLRSMMIPASSLLNLLFKFLYFF